MVREERQGVRGLELFDMNILYDGRTRWKNNDIWGTTGPVTGGVARSSVAIVQKRDLDEEMMRAASQDQAAQAPREIWLDTDLDWGIEVRDRRAVVRRVSLASVVP
jgi:hypothetical protein